jgi:bacterioferritin (cytochrome b1)
MDLLADEIGEIGAEPDMKPGIYPHDPTSNASLLRSYVAWEDGLVRGYAVQAAEVESIGVKRVLMQQSKESAIHLRRFADMLAKLGPAAEEPLVYADTGELATPVAERLHQEMTSEYRLVLQHLRHAFVFDAASCPVGSELELTAMRHMKHLSHFAEKLAETGHGPEFVHPELDAIPSMEAALQSDIELTREAGNRFAELSRSPDLEEEAGLRTELQNMVYQEEFLASNVEGLLKEVQAPVTPAEADARGPSAQTPDAGRTGGFTVGGLIEE